jgi:hypothetical protein
MTEVKAEDWRVVLVTVDNTKCRLCGEVVHKGERAWFLPGRGLQCLECPEKVEEETRP